jgi:hypothetical protein
MVGVLTRWRWSSSVIPADGGYVMPLKGLARNAEGVTDGDPVAVELSVRTWSLAAAANLSPGSLARLSPSLRGTDD